MCSSSEEENEDALERREEVEWWVRQRNPAAGVSDDRRVVELCPVGTKLEDITRRLRKHVARGNATKTG